MTTTTDIEKVNLEAHVEICAVRYHNLDVKLSNLERRMDAIEGKMDDLEDHMVEIKDALASRSGEQDAKLLKILLTIFGVVLAGLIGFMGNSILK